MINTNQPNNRDEWLASFADQVLLGQADATPVDGPDSEMRALAETIVRLNRAYPKREADRAMMTRIQNGVLQKWRVEEQKKARKPAFLRQDWLALFKRPKFAMAMAVIAIIGIFAFVGPLLLTGGDLPATAGSDDSSSIFTWLLLGLLIVAAFWFARGKKS